MTSPVPHGSELEICGARHEDEGVFCVLPEGHQCAHMTDPNSLPHVTWATDEQAARMEALMSDFADALVPVGVPEQPNSSPENLTPTVGDASSVAVPEQPADEAVQRGAHALCRFIFPGCIVPRAEMARAVLRAAATTGDPTEGLDKRVIRGGVDAETVASYVQEAREASLAAERRAEERDRYCKALQEIADAARVQDSDALTWAIWAHDRAREVLNENGDNDA